MADHALLVTISRLFAPPYKDVYFFSIINFHGFLSIRTYIYVNILNKNRLSISKASQITSSSFVCSQLIQSSKHGNIKVPHYWSSVGVIGTVMIKIVLFHVVQTDGSMEVGERQWAVWSASAEIPCSDWRNALQWRKCGRDGVWNHRRLDCLLNRLFWRKSKKTSKFRVTGLCGGNPPVTGGFPSQRASNAENVSIWWRHHGIKTGKDVRFWYDRSIVWRRLFYAVLTTLLTQFGG